MLGCLSGAHLACDAVRNGGKRIHFVGTVREDGLPSCSWMGSLHTTDNAAPVLCALGIPCKQGPSVQPARERSMTRRTKCAA